MNLLVNDTRVLKLTKSFSILMPQLNDFMTSFPDWASSETSLSSRLCYYSAIIAGAYVVVWLEQIRKIKRAIMRAGAGIITHAYIQIAHLT